MQSQKRSQNSELASCATIVQPAVFLARFTSRGADIAAYCSRRISISLRYNSIFAKHFKFDVLSKHDLDFHELSPFSQYQGYYKNGNPLDVLVPTY